MASTDDRVCTRCGLDTFSSRVWLRGADVWICNRCVMPVLQLVLYEHIADIAGDGVRSKVLDAVRKEADARRTADPRSRTFVINQKGQERNEIYRTERIADAKKRASA